MKPLRINSSRWPAWLALLSFTSLATAGVIPGHGSKPSAQQLGTTNATGFQVAESGPGHALVVPYFTAQSGQMSVVHVVNTDTHNGKAVKLRYRGASGADTLLDLVILLSPGDAWTGAITAGMDGRAQLTTSDHTCTVPRLPAQQPQPFSTARLNPRSSEAERAHNTREGYIEAIVMADIPSTAAYGPHQDKRSALSTAIQQITGVPPCTAEALDSALLIDTSDEPEAARRGFATPTSGLMGSWYIIDVPGSTTFSGAAHAFTAVNQQGQAARGNYMVFPQTGEVVSQPERYTADPLLVSAGLAGRRKTSDGSLSQLTSAPSLQALFSDLPDLSTPYYLPPSAANARRTAGDLTQALAVKSVKNQYALDRSITAQTDWVLSMPTMRYSIAYDHTVTGSTPTTLYSLISPRDSAEQFFSDDNIWGQSNSSSTDFPFVGPKLRIRLPEFGTTHHDREATPTVNTAGFWGAQPSMPPWTGAVTVISFGGFGQSPLKATLSNLPLTSGVYSNGWSEIDTRIQNTQLGLPVIGSAFIKLNNPQAQPGVAGNYGITWPHGYTR